MERTRRRSRLLSSAVVWAVFVMLWMQFSVSPSALAANVFGGSADGSTTCSPTGIYCEAYVDNLIMTYALDVDPGDDVFYTMDVEWLDTRGSPSPKAEHLFKISVVFPGPVVEEQPYPVDTYGQASGSDTFALWIYNVNDDVTVTVYFNASLYIASPYCNVHDSDGGRQLWG